MPISPAVTERLVVHPEVAAALADGRPVVALESTLISHGLPYPQNLEVASASEAAVRETDGAVPATVAIRDGSLLVGLDAAALEALATAPAGSVRKAARPTLAVALAEGGWAATTVSATMIAAHAAGIGVFATGGIGGVHRGALAVAGGGAPSFDISSDLEELGRTPMAVVCAGPKAILDVPATLEYLETRGVPVISVGQAELPGFYARSSGIEAPHVVADVAGAAAVVDVHLGLGLGSGVLVCVPVPREAALPEDVARDAVERAIADAATAGVHGPALTPWLLARIAELTSGASIRANTALIVNDARIAGELAAALA
ncbi:MAG TPA: pseudouridine-5'-phosphate glycosidase [Methylomirabilota bacterium]|nr:pseudouridine-5'-phosphate glycosidase [Methylomirabilota bacterium]